jgi:hypothetical protein
MGDTGIQSGKGAGYPGLADMNPTSLIHALSQIEHLSMVEMDNDLPPEYINSLNTLHFTEMGFKAALTSTLFCFSESIVTFMAVKGHIPIFGSTHPSLLEELYSYTMNLALPLSFSLLIGMILFKTFRGAATKKVINSLLTGYVASVAIWSVVFFLLINIIHYKLLTPESIYNMVSTLNETLRKEWVWPYDWLMKMRSVLIPSALFALFSSIASVSVIASLWYIGLRRSEKFKDFLQEWE